MQQALEALESDPISHAGLVNRKQAITALRQALETKQEPVALPCVYITSQKDGGNCYGDGTVYRGQRSKDSAVPTYTVQELADSKGVSAQPVAWLSEGGDVSRSKRYMDEMGFKCNPLYTAPPKKEWVGLTDEERNSLWRDAIGWGDPSHDDEDLMKVIEAKLKEKNT
jgi:hypothetical protein